MNTQKKTYTKGFKEQAIELAESMGNIKAAAHQLGVRDSAIHEWRRQKLGLARKDLETSGLSDVHEELKRLRKENMELKKVNHILKAAAAFFSQDHLK